jgi:uncharacterized protein (TIGR02270 family)
MQNSYLSTSKNNAYRSVFDHYIIDASFLWVLRSINVKQPHYTVEELAELDQRIERNLDGLMHNFELAWDICLEELAFKQAGETFTAAIIAFRSRDFDKIKYIVHHAFTNEETFKGLVSALGWLPKPLVTDWLTKFLYSKDLDHKYLAIAVCSVRRKNPRDILNEILTREDCLAHHKLLVRALRLVGELKLYSLSNLVFSFSTSDNAEVKFWSNWSLVLLGENKGIINLFDSVSEPSEWQLIATQIAFKVLPVKTAREWISVLAKKPKMERTVIRATGYLGDPHAIPWLIDQMNSFDTAKIAGEAFTLITGIDLARYKLVIDTPKEIDAVPNDNSEDDGVALDEDENLPFPDVNKINHVWLRYRERYQASGRYLMGLDVSQSTPNLVTQLHALLKHSTQRQRQSLALTLALLDPQSPYINSAEKV